MNAAPRWGVFKTGDHVHVIPLEDTREHNYKACSCGPKCEKNLVIHNSFDGREIAEAAKSYAYKASS